MTTSNLNNRIITSSIRSTIPCEGGMSGDVDAWHCIRNATIRVLKRELNFPKYKDLPVELFHWACDYASLTYGMRGWDSTFINALDEMRDDLNTAISAVEGGE